MKSADEIRAEAMRDPVLASMIEAIEANGGRVASEQELLDLLKRSPEQRHEAAVLNEQVFQLELAEQCRELDWRPGMGEISGFGGSYELACRAMLRAGVRWMREHPDADPKFKGFKGVFGLMADDNEDAKALSRVVVEACPGGGASGAMHQVVVSTVLFIAKNGWDAYCEEMSKEVPDA